MAGELIELYEFIGPGLAYRYTSDRHRTISYGGNDYAPTPIRRGKIVSSGPLGDYSLTVDLPVSTQLIQDYVPIQPDSLLLTIYSGTSPTGAFAKIWEATVKGIMLQGPGATLRTDWLFNDMLNQPVPNVWQEPLCQHNLGDSRCTIDLDLAAYKVSTTVSAISADGKTITVASVGGKADGFFKLGGMVKADGQRKMVTGNTGTSITLWAPFYSLAVNDAIDLVAGCDKAITTCRDKFSNAVNHSGFPYMPTKDIHRIQLPGSL